MCLQGTIGDFPECLGEFMLSQRQLNSLDEDALDFLIVQVSWDWQQSASQSVSIRCSTGFETALCCSVACYCPTRPQQLALAMFCHQTSLYLSVCALRV